jgi:hypothetical protein
VRPDATELKELARVGANNPVLVRFIKRSYGETLKQLVGCDATAFPQLQGKARTLELLLHCLDTEA